MRRSDDTSRYIQVWINQGDIILLSLRDFQDDKADVIQKYTADEARNLKAYGELPETAKINETDTFGPGEDDDNIEFDEEEIEYAYGAICTRAVADLDLTAISNLICPNSVSLQFPFTWIAMSRTQPHDRLIMLQCSFARGIRYCYASNPVLIPTDATYSRQAPDRIRSKVLCLIDRLTCVSLSRNIAYTWLLEIP